MVFLFAWCHLSHAQECTHSLWHLLKSSRTTAPCPLDSLEKAGAACSDTLVLSKSQLHLSCTMCHNLLESFEQVVPNYSEITSRESYIFLPPEITGVAKHNWMCSQMKKPHSLQESSFQPWGAQGLWSTPKCSFLTQGKIFGIWKNTPLQAGGSRWEADASPIGMVHAEKGLAAVVAWSPLMVCCPPQAGHLPPILGGSLLSPCWLQADVPRVQMQICHGRACPRGTDHLLCFHQSTSEGELQRVPAASLQKQNNFTSQFYRDTNFIESGEWTQFYLNYFVFPFFASICFSFFAAVLHYFFSPLFLLLPCLLCLSQTLLAQWHLCSNVQTYPAQEGSGAG